VQHYEINRSRPEARSLLRFDVTPEQADFPHAAQAAEMDRFIDRDSKREEQVEREYLLTSLRHSELNAEQMLRLDRDYWGIESGLHQRLDVSAHEDKSRLRTPKAAFNLCLFRRATTSFAIHWIQHQHNKRAATTSGFYDAMAAKGARKAFSLVTAKHPSWLPPK
jgi:predicted transposase YbfD/YdcC